VTARVHLFPGHGSSRLGRLVVRNRVTVPRRGRTQVSHARSGAGMWSRSRTAATLAAVLLSAGCSSEPEKPRALPSVSSVSASPSASAAVPPSAQAATPQGAAAFARFWYSQLTAAFEARDPSPVARLSAPGCTACETYIASLTSLRDDNERVEFDLQVVAATAPEDETGPETQVAVIYNSKGSVRYDATGAVIAREPARTNAEQTLTLVRVDEGWKVREVTAG
jgi:hypothetical protein